MEKNNGGDEDCVAESFLAFLDDWLTEWLTLVREEQSEFYERTNRIRWMITDWLTDWLIICLTEWIPDIGEWLTDWLW